MSAHALTPKANDYELQQVTEIGAWKGEEPSVISQAFGFAIEPLAWLVNKIVPESAIRAVLDGANSVGEYLADEADVLRDGGVTSIEALRAKDLEVSDRIANVSHNWANGLATGIGGGGGVFGLPGMAVDIPLTITLALRSIHKIGLCYGYRCDDVIGKQFVLGILAASGANSQEERIAAIATLHSLGVVLQKVTWKQMTMNAAQNQFSKDALLMAVKQLARQLGINITKRKALGAIPIIGAAIGGSVNYWYMNDVCWAARRAFQERWLREQGRWPEGKS